MIRNPSLELCHRAELLSLLFKNDLWPEISLHRRSGVRHISSTRHLNSLKSFSQGKQQGNRTYSSTATLESDSDQLTSHPEPVLKQFKSNSKCGVTVVQREDRLAAIAALLISLVHSHPNGKAVVLCAKSYEVPLWHRALQVVFDYVECNAPIFVESESINEFRTTDRAVLVLDSQSTQGLKVASNKLTHIFQLGGGKVESFSNLASQVFRPYESRCIIGQDEARPSLATAPLGVPDADLSAWRTLALHALDNDKKLSNIKSTTYQGSLVEGLSLGISAPEIPLLIANTNMYALDTLRYRDSHSGGRLRPNSHLPPLGINVIDRMGLIDYRALLHTGDSYGPTPVVESPDKCSGKVLPWSSPASGRSSASKPTDQVAKQDHSAREALPWTK